MHNKNQPRTNGNSQSYKTSSPHHRFITLPNSSSSHSIINNMNELDIKTTLSSKTIHELVHFGPQRYIFSDERVYCIPYKNSKLKYTGETSRNLHVRLKEHKRDVKFGNLNNALFQNNSQSNHDFYSTKMPIYIQNKKKTDKFSKPLLFGSVIP